MMAQALSSGSMGSAAVVIPLWAAVVGGLVVLVALGATYLWTRRRMRAQADRFRAMFNKAPEAMWLLSRDGRILEANSTAGRLTGRSLKNLTGRRLQRVMELGEDVDFASLPDRLDDEKAVPVEAHLAQDAGTRRLHGHISALALGEHTRYLAVLQDVTDERKRRSLFQRFHRKAMNDLPIEAAVLSPRGDYIYANEQATSEAPGGLLRKTDVDYVQEVGLHPEVALRRRSHRKRAIATGERIHFEETLSFSDGTVRHFDRFYTPVFDQEDEIYAVVSYGLETTTLKQYRAQQEEAKKEVEEFSQLKSSFLENISHEFRTPLTGIIGSARILQEEVAEGHREFADIIERSGRRLMNTLNAMLDLAGLNADGVRMRPQVVDLAREVERVAEDLQEEAKEEGLFLRTQATQPEVLTRLDPACLYRVLRGLMSNALKFTETGGVVAEVGADAEQVYVRVIDTGVGIGNDFLPELFEEFTQESTGDARDFEGIGVGLTVVERLVDLMGGTIEVNSEKGEGSTFTIALPGLSFSSQQNDALRPRLLVAQANENTQKLLRHVLDPYVQVDEATDMADALEQARRITYDVVFLDVELDEERAGTDLLEAVRALDGYADVPVVAVANQDEPGTEQQFLGAGYNHFLARPFEKRALLNALGDLLERSDATASRQEGQPVLV